ncbi:MAG: tryptophan-rich sensory protein [Synechococcus sp.]
MNRNIVRQWTTMVAIWASFSANILANLIPLKGLSIGAISNQLFGDVLITPENYAFSVWGIIFLGLISFAFFQARSSQRHNPQLQRIGFLLVASSLAQIVWVIVFLMRWFPLSLAAMLAILLPLMEAYRRLQVDKQPVSSQQLWLVRVPISIYLSWLALATILNVAIALTALGWSGGGISPVLWTGIAMVLAAGVAAIAAIAHGDVAYIAVFAWGLVAIAVRQWEIPELAFTALGLVAINIIVLLVSLGRRKFSQPSKLN